VIGARFGRLTVVAKYCNSAKRSLWECSCDCGGSKVVRESSLKTGNTKSCGCFHKEIVTTHGDSRKTESLYATWKNMIKRCTNQSHKSWMNYGGRGITVCDEWLEYAKYKKDMGEKPFLKAQIDRIDNNKGYYKENCRWVSPKENCRNTRTNNLVTLAGVTKTIPEWSESTGILEVTIRTRLRRGWPAEKALSDPQYMAERKRIEVIPNF